MSTGIEWTDEVWNPVTGCTPVSEGCEHCYAKRMAKRLAGRYGYPKDDPFAVTFHPDRLNQPLRWTKPRRVFPCSMGDLFHRDVSLGRLGMVFDVMMHCSQHTFLLLTKRPEIARQRMKILRLPLMENVWLGVSVENQARADERIPILLDIPVPHAGVRFVSVEPMLGPVDLVEYLPKHEQVAVQKSEWGLRRSEYILRKRRAQWVICGCESGPGRRETKVEWIRDLRDQCEAYQVPFFLKQREIDGKVVHMPELDGKVWDQMPDAGGNVK